MGGMGSKAEKKKLGLDDLENLLGERLPKLEFSPRGRLRLLTAFQKRFGDSYRNLPGVDDILKEFDDEAKFNVTLMRMKLIKAGK